MPGLGSIIQIDGKGELYVVVGYKSYEDCGSCSHDERWHLLPLKEMETRDHIILGEGLEVHVTGITRTPDIVEVKDVAPFILSKEIRYNIRRAIPKTITIYE